MNLEGTSVHGSLVGLDRVVIFTARLLAGGTLWKEWREGRKVISAGMIMSHCEDGTNTRSTHRVHRSETAENSAVNSQHLVHTSCAGPRLKSQAQN